MRRLLSLTVTVVLGAVVAVVAPLGLVPAQASRVGTVTTDYTLLRAKPHGFVLGHAYRDQLVAVQQEPSEGYQWARIGNSFDDCAWIFQGAVRTSVDYRDLCRHSDRGIHESRFARFIALGGDTTANPTNGTDGLPAHIDVNAHPACTIRWGSGTAAFGNVDAIEGGSATPKDQLFEVPNGHPVLWRYLTRDYRWFLVRDPSRGPTDGFGEPSWYFVQSHCVVPDQIHPHRYVP